MKKFGEKTEKKIEITENELTEKIARIIADDEHINQFIKINPIMIMAFTILSGKIIKALFNETEGEKNEVQE